MSWLDELQTTLTIRTGDGSEYTPLWVNPKFVTTYNTKEFNFPGVMGTFVDKRQAQGSKYSLEIYFKGEDHLDQMKAFMNSAKDRRPWTIIHPYYDIIVAQPLSIGVDNSKYNVSKITATIKETIEQVNPRTNLIPEDKVDEDVELSNESIANSITDVDNQSLTSQVDEMLVNGSPLILSDEDGQSFFNSINEARETINSVSATASQKMRSVQALLRTPSLFQQNLDSKLQLLSGNFNSLVGQIKGTSQQIKDLPLDFKNTFESFGASLINSLSITAATPSNLIEDYPTVNDIDNTALLIVETYNTFIENLELLAVGDGNSVGDYQPLYETVISVQQIVNFTISNLFVIAKNVRQERKLILEDDSDFISLAHRLYGLRPDDSTIDELILNNSNLGINGILEIKKGTCITYFV